MKHTKKRAIFSAVAMLVVSAIALSSATYAWFSAGTTVSAGQLSASITNNDGSLLITADTPTLNNWKTNLEAADIIGSTSAGNVLPAGMTVTTPTAGVFTPVTVNFSAASITPLSGEIEISDVAPFTRTVRATGNAAGGYLKYTVWVKSSVDANIKITPYFSNTVAFIYGGVILGSQKSLLGAAGDSYYPLANTSVTGTDSNANDVLDAADVGFAPAMLGAQQTVAADPIITTTVPLVGGTATPIVVYMWAEGQDLQCSGPIGTANGDISLVIERI